MAGSLGRKRVRTTRVAIQGGGSVVTGTANLAWGPAFGRGVGQEELQCAAHMPLLDTVGVDIVQTCGCQDLIDAWDLNFNPITGGNLGASLSGTGNDLNILYDFVIPIGDTTGVSMNTVPNLLDMDFGVVKTCGCTHSFDLAADYTNSAGAHMSGTSIGAPSWASATTITSPAGAATFDIAVPSGTVDGDLLVMHGSTENTGTTDNFVTPSGWTLIVSINFAGSLVNIRSNTWYRVASSEPASYTVSLVAPGTSNQGKLMEMHRIQGVDGTTPINANTTATLLSTALSTAPAAPSVTTTTANCLVMAFLAHDHQALANSHTPAAGEVERTDFQNSTLTIGSQSCDTKVFAATGATGTTVFTCSETVSTDAAMHRIAIAPGSITLAT